MMAHRCNRANWMAAMIDRPRLRRADVPAYMAQTHGIDIAVATLAKLASIGGGPSMEYIGRTPLYAKASLDAWARQRLGTPVNSTSERGAA